MEFGLVGRAAATGCCAQRLDEQLPLLLFGQVGHGISSFICGTETPPRLCEPPCSEKQAGIGPISQKPELLTMGRTYNGGWDYARTDRPP
jgi:hypothetical protein